MSADSSPSGLSCSLQGPASKLHIFDMDGTLLRGNACLHLARHVGQLEAALEIEERWSSGDIGDVQFWELFLPLWNGLNPADVEQVFEAAQWLEGIADVFADINRRGEHAALITGSPQFFADLLLRWGLCSVRGTVVEVGMTPDPASVITPDSKVWIARELMEHHGVTADDCVAYADSASDVALFRSLRHTVAVNAADALKKVASVAYDGDDLRGAYAAGRSLLGDDRSS